MTYGYGGALFTRITSNLTHRTASFWDLYHDLNPILLYNYTRLSKTECHIRMEMVRARRALGSGTLIFLNRYKPVFCGKNRFPCSGRCLSSLTREFSDILNVSWNNTRIMPIQSRVREICGSQ